MEKLKMLTPNLVNDNIEKIKQIFPDCITEHIGGGQTEFAVDFDKLRQELSSNVVEGNEERYQFIWPGKKQSIITANAPISKTLRPCREESVDFDNTENLYIEGDNLDVLKLLREDYLGKVKMIYIDPPYNTGNDFVYEDNFAQSADDYIENSGQQDDVGNHLVANTENNGRFHTDWLNMIYPRLKVARDFLSDDGIIFVSIDEHEAANCKKILEEIYGCGNFVGTIVLQTATDNNPGQIKIQHEYILCVAKNKKLAGNWFADKEETKLIQKEYLSLKKQYGNNPTVIQKHLREWIKKNEKNLEGITQYDNVDEKGVYHDGDIANTTFGGYEYEIIHPVTGKVCKMPEKGYRFPKETMDRMIKENNVLFGKDETTLPKPKKRLEDAKDLLRSVIYEDGRASTKRFEKLMSRDIFQNPKSETIIGRLINFICKDDDLVLDFFAGSSTTAEAVFMNNVKNKHLKFILIQIPEDIDSSLLTASPKTKKTMANAIKFLDSIHKPHLITEIGKERIRRAGKLYTDEVQDKHSDSSGEELHPLDVGFRVLKVDSSNMKDVYYKPSEVTNDLFVNTEDNIKEDRTDEDLLFQVMLELAVPLSAKIRPEEICGRKVMVVDDNYLIACFDKDITDEVVTDIAKRKPQYFVMRDSSAMDDSVITNFETIFQTYSKDTVRKIL